MSALTKKWFVKTDNIYKGGEKIFAPKIERYSWFFYRSFFKLFPKFMTTTMFKEVLKFRPITYNKYEIEELKKMTFIMRSYQGFNNDLDQDIDQYILKQIKCPTLILHSNFDNAVDISHAKNTKNKKKFQDW